MLYTVDLIPTTNSTYSQILDFQFSSDLHPWKMLQIFTFYLNLWILQLCIYQMWFTITFRRRKTKEKGKRARKSADNLNIWASPLELQLNIKHIFLQQTEQPSSPEVIEIAIVCIYIHSNRHFKLARNSGCNIESTQILWFFCFRFSNQNSVDGEVRWLMWLYSKEKEKKNRTCFQNWHFNSDKFFTNYIFFTLSTKKPQSSIFHRIFRIAEFTILLNVSK